MKSYRIVSIVFFWYSLLTAVGFAQNIRSASKPKLIFQTGFEGSTALLKDTTSMDHGAFNEYFTGKDNTLPEKSDMNKDIKDFLSGGVMQIQFTGGDSSKRYGRITTALGNPQNKVLKFWLNDFWLASEGQQKARIQANLYGIKPGLKEFYQSVRVYFSDDFSALKKYPKNINWLTISEFWNNEWWDPKEKYGFRVTLGIGKPIPEASDLEFILNAENAGQKEVWKVNNHNVKVPIGQWFTMEYYFKEGNEKTGRFYLAITPANGKKEIVYDVHNFTCNTTDPAPDGLTGYNPMKLYTSKDVVGFMKAQGRTLQVYWDDFKLWTGRQPESN